ncbi:histidine phosphatase family protein [Thermobifida halotolerans]|uniref:Histidine phosphatase family protein n=1 Tax=Thermobifida halotolerans TaxID=483545 RepID=A0A399G1B0_9ACTN|nr:histidine phosphatase family protein [Thermobifida halotolerans]UOE19198.1 histidine phosphatase family protein [Thermobifida halotolerans]
MSRRLIVLRHAQAEHSASLSDIERPLSGEGRGQARAVGALLAREGLLPEHVLCSTAQRTRQTWGLVAEELPCEPEVDFEAELYTADVDTALRLVTLVDPEVRTLLLVGHNPTMAQLAAAFDSDSGYLSFPPASAAVIDLEVDWLYAAPGTGSLRLLN